MEGKDEKQWRLDAAWAIAAIIAVVLFVLNGASRAAFSPAGAPEPAVPYSEVLLYRRLLTYIVWMFIGGGFLFLFYSTAEAFRVRIFLKPEEQPITWTLWDVGKGATATYLSTLGLMTFLPFSEDEAVYQLIASGYILHIALWAAAAYFVTQSGGSHRAMGFTGRAFPLNVLHGLLAYGATLPFFYFAMAISLFLAQAVGYQPQPDILTPMLKNLESPWLEWILIVMITLFGPLTEEIFFRGFLYPAMRRRMTVLPAIILNGALFGLIHLSFTGFLPIMVLGMTMAYLFEKSRSLASCTTLHVAHNTLEILIVYNLVG